jgi:hypothetical protein
MPVSADHPEPSRRELAELSALADGTLDPARRADVQAHISASPQLTELYARELGSVELLHRARERDRAPAALRARIEAARPSPASRARRRVGYGGALAGALAVVVLALVLILPAGTPGAPSLGQAAGLAGLSATAPAPGLDPRAPNTKLATRIEDLYFPNWQGKFNWRAVGWRSDRINGRLALTMYYTGRQHRVAYTIVGAPTLGMPSGSAQTIHGVQFQTVRIGGRTVVTWRESNHTCLLSGPGVPASVLRMLASWKGAERLGSS